MSIREQSRGDFHALLRIARGSIAEPTWFAAPVEAHEDPEMLTIGFHIPGLRRNRVRVDATETSVMIGGLLPPRRERAWRLCSFPFAIDSSRIATSRAGDLLRLNIPKKSPLAFKTGSPAENQAA